MTTVDDTLEQLTLVSVQTLKSYQLQLHGLKFMQLQERSLKKNPSSTGFKPSPPKY